MSLLLIVRPVLLSLLLVVLIASSARGAGPAETNPYRLPTFARPLRYQVYLRADPASGQFSGQETITVELKKPSKEIFLNSRDLLLSDVKAGKGGNAKTAMVKIDERLQKARLAFSKELAAGQHEVSLKFRGKMSDKLCGLYRSKYKKKDGSQGWFACTQFEPSDARLMLPCFDEPAMKAKFKLTVNIEPAFTAVSNMPVASESVKQGRKEIAFEESPAMSSYLLALVIGDYRACEPVVVEGVPIRVWCIGREPEMGIYGRDMAAQLMKFLSGYFKVPYGFKKLDLIAVPDFEAGAMENPGAITFRETLLLVDEKTASLDTKQEAVSVIAHEMAHLWFGDIVTMKWWNDLWLNEAFATWMSVKAVANVVPQWNYLSWYGMERLQGMGTDSMHSTRAIHARVGDPLEARQMFDEITYQKGAAMLRMIEMYVGEDRFQKGVAAYMEKFKYANADGGDLWLAIEKASGKPVSQIMDAWTNMPGYPLVTVVREAGRLLFNQERFFIDGSRARPPQAWRIPVGLRFLAGTIDSNSQPVPDRSVLAGPGPTPLEFKRDETSPLFANCGGYGFYRVRYPSALVDDLKTVMKDRLTAVERLTLLADQWALLVSGKISLPDYVKILSQFKDDGNFLSWQTVGNHLAYLDLVVPQERSAAFAAYIRGLARPEAERLGWTAKEGEAPDVKLTRASVINLLGTYGQDQKIIAEARRFFDQYVKDPQSVSADMVETATAIVCYNGGRDDYRRVKTLWKTASSPETEHRNLFMLAHFRQQSLLSETLGMALTSEVKIQDGPHLIQTCLKNHAGKEQAWIFVRNNWTKLRKIYSSDMMIPIVSSCDQFTTAARLREVKQFFAGHPVKGAEPFTARMIERLATNVAFAGRVRKPLESWLGKL